MSRQMIWDDRYRTKCAKHAALEAFDVHARLKQLVTIQFLIFKMFFLPVGRLTS